MANAARRGRGWCWVAAAMVGIGSAQGQRDATGVAEGRVLGPLGEPMRGVEVTAAIWPALDQVIGATRTDGDGMFVLGRLPLRTVTLLATTPGHTVGWATASLSAERTADGVQFRVWDANTLRGVVVDAEDRPVADAVVLGSKDYTWFDGHFRAPEVRSDAEGRFTLRGVPIGDCVVRAWAPGFELREHTLFATADTEVRVQLTRGAGARLSIRTSGLPADPPPAVSVRIYATRGGSGFNLPSVLEGGSLDVAGALEIRGLPDAEWNVELNEPDHTFDPRSVRTKAGETDLELAFRATRIGSLQLRGTLRREDGTPLADQTLLCRTRRSQSMNGGTPGRALTDAEGRFTLLAPLVENEPYSLHLIDSPFVLQQTKVKDHTGSWDKRYLVRYEDNADLARELALVAVPAAFVTGRLVDADGGSVPFQWTELQERKAEGRSPEWMGMAYATSRRDGTVVFPGVHAIDDDVRIRVEGKGGAGHTEPFRLQRGAQQELQVRVERPGMVTGRVLDAKGGPLVGVRVSLRNFDVATGAQVDGGWTNVPTDRLGRFVFVGVAPGGHRIDVDRQETGKGESEVFAVAPGATVKMDLVVAR